MYLVPEVPSPAFLAYNEGKLRLEAGRVWLLPAGWVEYGTLFVDASMPPMDGLTFVDFKRNVCIARERVEVNLFRSFYSLNPEFSSAGLSPSNFSKTSPSKVSTLPLAKKQSTVHYLPSARKYLQG